MSRCVSARFQLESFMEDLAQQVPFMPKNIYFSKGEVLGRLGSAKTEKSLWCQEKSKPGFSKVQLL